MHARAHDEGVARAALLHWHHSASASRSASAAAAAAAESAAAVELAEFQLQRIAVQLAASAEAQRKRQQDHLIASFRSIVAVNQSAAAAAAAAAAAVSPSLAVLASPRTSRSNSLGFEPLPPPSPQLQSLHVNQSIGSPYRRSFSLHMQLFDAAAAAAAADNGLDGDALDASAASVAAAGASLESPPDSAAEDDGHSDVVLERQQMLCYPFVWLVLRQAAAARAWARTQQKVLEQRWK